jgi:hypothetical protein
MLTELVGSNMNEIIKATLGSDAFPNATEEEKKQIDEFIDMVVIAHIYSFDHEDHSFGE